MRSPPHLDTLLNPELHPINAYFWSMGSPLSAGRRQQFSRALSITIRRSGWEKVRIVESSILLRLFLGFLSFCPETGLEPSAHSPFRTVSGAAACCGALAGASSHQRKQLRFPSKHIRNILIVGTSPKARKMGALVSRYSDWGLRILGYVDVKDAEKIKPEGDILGSVADLPDIIENNVVDEIIFVGDRPSLDVLDKVLEFCSEQGIRIRVAADFFPAKVTNLSMEFVENVPVITFSSAPEHAPSLLIKRILDILLSAAMLVILLPFLAVIGLLVKLTSRGPVIYRQVRCGLYGRRFNLYKIRSMYNGAEDVLWEIRHLNEMDGPVFKMRNDPRVTPLGRFLRKSSIDELPQLWNVLKGDEPGRTAGAAAGRSQEYTRWQRRRLSVKRASPACGSVRPTKSTSTNG